MPVWIEAQRSLGDKNLIRTACNRAEYLPKRRRMLEEDEWANYLDGLREQAR